MSKGITVSGPKDMVEAAIEALTGPDSGTGFYVYDDGNPKSVELRSSADPEACPGCGCTPGDGRTEGCDHPEGCGYLAEQAKGRGLEYLALGYHGWQRDPDLRTAIRGAKRRAARGALPPKGSKRRPVFAVYMVSADAFIDGMGFLQDKSHSPEFYGWCNAQGYIVSSVEGCKVRDLEEKA